MRLDFVAIPAPPETVADVQIGRLVFIVLHDELAEIPHDFRQMVRLFCIIQAKSIQCKTIRRQRLRLVTIEEALHLLVEAAAFAEDPIDHRIQIVGMRLMADFLRIELQTADLILLIVVQPLDAALQHVVGND